jgi:phosphodiesterase/alkaline phosphatase D-like protein
MGVCSMNRLLVKLAITAAAGSLLYSSPIGAQNPPPAPKAAHVEIIKGPGLEVAHDDLAIIRWTSTNPGGDDDHYAVAHYGTDPKDLSQTAKNHIRLNQAHAETIFRVRLQPLKPDTTYYYKVTSMGYDGVSDGVESPVNHFTTAAPGQQTSAHPPPE